MTIMEASAAISSIVDECVFRDGDCSQCVFDYFCHTTKKPLELANVNFETIFGIQK